MRTQRSALRAPTRPRWPAYTVAPGGRGWWEVQDAARRRRLGTHEQYRSAVEQARLAFDQER